MNRGCKISPHLNSHRVAAKRGEVVVDKLNVPTRRVRLCFDVLFCGQELQQEYMFSMGFSQNKCIGSDS
jgi:hypothetical protein